MRRITGLFLFLMLTCAGYLKTFTQETTSEIQGSITDEKSAPLQGATIKAVHTPTGTVYTTTSRKDGRYNLPNVLRWFFFIHRHYKFNQ